MAFRESDGQFLWQSVHDKLAAGRANDWPYQGVCSSPLVENGIAYYVSNRGELMAVDIDGFRDGTNDGLVKDEKSTRETDVDIIWRYDMMEELGVLQHNMANSSPVMYENLIFVSTSNGQDESHVNIPSPKAPAIIAVDKNTGKLVWEDNSVGEKILHGQWSSPAVGKVGDIVQVVIGQGDGWVRGYEAKTGKKLWEFDLNPKDSVWPKTRNEVISTPVIYENVVYIANGQDPEHGEGVGHLYAIDPTKRGDITHDRPDLAVRQDPPLDLDRIDLQRHPVLLRLQRLPARARRQDRQAVLDARHVRRDLGLADGDRRQGLPRRRGRRRRGPRRRPHPQGDRREQHGQLGLLDAGAGQRHALRRQPQPAVRAQGIRRLHRQRQMTRRAAMTRGTPASCRVTVSVDGGRRRCRRRRRCAFRRPLPADRVAAVPRLGGAERHTSAAAMPATLKLLWTYDAGDAIESSAAIADGVVYVGSRTGELHAVNLADGSVKWKYKASADGIGESSPAVAGGLVYVGDLSGVVHAVDVATGKAAWTFKTGGEVKSSPVVAGDRVLIGSYDSNLYALGAKDGKVLWKVQTEGYVHATPAVVDGVAYVDRLRRDPARDPRRRRQGGARRCRPAPTPARRR